jgi:phospholipase/lecithinase/hemolysin
MSYVINRFIYTLSVMFLLLSAQAGQAKEFREIVGFGDSLTDVGNVAGVTIPGNAPLLPGYFEQTHFSDGILFIEWLAETLDLPPITPGRGSDTTLPPLPNGNDWAWGGSEAATGTDQPSSVTEPIPNLITQVQDYLASNDPSCEILYSIFAGADNLLIGGNASPEEAVSAADAVDTSIRLLERAGARNFLIFNLPDLGDTPAAIFLGPAFQAAATLYTDTFNAALKASVSKLRRRLLFRGGHIYFVDVNSEFLLAIDTVKAGGTYTPSFFVPGPPVAITNVTDEAFFVFLSTGTFPTNFLFWDDVHPTTQGHQVLAGLALQALRRSNGCHKKHESCSSGSSSSSSD